MIRLIFVVLVLRTAVFVFLVPGRALVVVGSGGGVASVLVVVVGGMGDV